MPSRADRHLVEQALRALALVALATAALRLWRGERFSGDGASVQLPALDSALVAWSITPPERGTLDATTLPSPTQRDWIVALRRSGLRFAWSVRDTVAGAVTIEFGVLPQSAARVSAFGTGAAPLRLSDQLGQVDSIAGTRAASWRFTPVGAVRLTSGAIAAIAEPRDSLAAGPVLVLGSAGWESKFVTAALEESGWTVASRITIAPGAVVRQGGLSPIDTSAFSAVVVLDSVSPIDAPTVAGFVRAGGGVLASGAGVRHPSLRGLLPRAGGVAPGMLGGLSGPDPHAGLAARTFRLAGNEVPLARRSDAPVVVGKRVGAGRVVAVGYDDTWRLRMAVPDESAPQAHRDWWSSLVGGVARVRLHPRAVSEIDEAPLANTIAALGPPARAGDPPRHDARLPWTAILAATAAASLLGEWLSRRLRGMA
ncbi:MAG TPA: hypothetical protein VFZ73_06045 [Gemmatimonadaceae bacterium]